MQKMAKVLYFSPRINRGIFLVGVIFFYWVFFLAADLNEIQFARVQYDGGGDWYNDPEIIPNFADFLSQNLKIKVNKKEKSVKLSDAEIFQYPFLLMTGHGNIVVNDAEVNNIRKYLLNGGFLYVDDDYGLDEAFRRLVRKVFPERTFLELPASHPIFHCYFLFPNGLPKIHEHDNQRPQLFAILDDIGRIMILYSFESNITDGWADANTHQDPPEVREKALQMGLNIFYYLFTEL